MQTERISKCNLLDRF